MVLWLLMIGCVTVTPVVPGADADGDGFAVPLDCDDTRPGVYPGTQELCDDGLDNDCDGKVDDVGLGSVPWFLDSDGDGHGADTMMMACKGFAEPGWSRSNDDCNDERSDAFPGGVEVCDGFDQDCDGEADNGFEMVAWYPDLDHDGFGFDYDAVLSCAEIVPDRVKNRDDCNDLDPSIRPGAEEPCDGIDNNCSGIPDDMGAASVNSIPFATIEAALDFALQGRHPVVDVCAGRQELPHSYILDGPTVDLALVGQGELSTTVFKDHVGDWYRVFSVENGARLTLSRLTAEGPGFTVGVPVVQQLARAMGGNLATDHATFVDWPSVFYGDEEIGQSVRIDVDEATFTSNRSLVYAYGGAEISITDSLADGNAPENDFLISVSSLPPVVAGGTIQINNSVFSNNNQPDLLEWACVVRAGRYATAVLTDVHIMNNVGVLGICANESVVVGVNAVVEGGGDQYEIGGGASMDKASLSGVIFRNNQAYQGGGVAAYSSRLENVQIVNNRANKGGGLWIVGSETSSIDGASVVHNNTAVEGPGAYLEHARVRFMRADFGNAAAQTDNGAGNGEVRTYDVDGNLLSSIAIDDEIVECYPDRACTIQ